MAHISTRQVTHNNESRHVTQHVLNRRVEFSMKSGGQQSTPLRALTTMRYVLEALERINLVPTPIDLSLGVSTAPAPAAIAAAAGGGGGVGAHENLERIRVVCSHALSDEVKVALQRDM